MLKDNFHSMPPSKPERRTGFRNYKRTFFSTCLSELTYSSVNYKIPYMYTIYMYLQDDQPTPWSSMEEKISWTGTPSLEGTLRLSNRDKNYIWMIAKREKKDAYLHNVQSGSIHGVSTTWNNPTKSIFMTSKFTQ